MKWLWSSWLALALGLAAGAAAADSRSFLAAQDAWQKGNVQALAGYADIMQKDPLGMYPRFWLLESGLMQADSTPEVLDFLAANKGTWLAARLRLDFLRALGFRKDWATFRSQYAQLADAPPNDVLCYDFQARLDGGDKHALPDARAILWFTGRDLPGSCDPVLKALTDNNVVTETDMWARLRLAFEAGNESVIRSLSQLLNEEISPATLLAIARSPERWLDKAPTATRMQRELVIYALGRQARGDLDGAEASLRRLGPALDDQATFAWRLLAVAAARQGDARALAWFGASGGLAYSSQQQEWRIRAALRAGDWDAVIDGIRALGDTGGKERCWQYWLARAYDARRLASFANRLYAGLSQDDDYYGLLARDRLGAVAQPLPKPFQASDADLARLHDNPGLQRALLLYEFGDRSDAVREWSWALRGADDHLLLAAATQAMAVGWYDRAIYAAEHTSGLEDYHLRFPAPYREVAHGYIDGQQLDEAWVYGLMRQESRFVAVAQSGVGAQGLMQLMPSTARWVARKQHLRYRSDMLSDVEGNIQLGTYYLRHVLDELGNNEVLATAAYNAGPSRVRSWQSDKPMDATIYVENIPFLETRDYVRKVMTNAVFYADAFGLPRQSLTQRLGTIPGRGTQAIEGP